jgi:hypothetical protein
MIDGLPVIDAVMHHYNPTRTAAREETRMPSITSDLMTREDIVRSELSIGGVRSTGGGRYFTSNQAVTRCRHSSPLTPSTHGARCARTTC